MTTILKMLSAVDGFDAAGGLANHGHREVDFERALGDFCSACKVVDELGPDAAPESAMTWVCDMTKVASRIGAVRVQSLADRLTRLQAACDDMVGIRAALIALQRELRRVSAEVRRVLDDLGVPAQ